MGTFQRSSNPSSFREASEFQFPIYNQHNSNLAAILSEAINCPPRRCRPFQEAPVQLCELPRVDKLIRLRPDHMQLQLRT